MTIVEIAKEAGVSIATVSRVLNNGPVSAAKRELVEAVVEKYKFAPNLLARSMIHKQSDAIGLITHGISNHFHTEFIEVVESRYSKMGILLFVCICQRDTQLENERRYLQDLVARQVNGIILHDSTPENYHSGFLTHIASQIPLVIVESFNSGNDINSVEVDQVFGMNQVMSHLMELGHRDIVFIRGGVGYSFQTKETVWQQTLTDAGVPPPPSNLLVVPEGNSETGILKTERMVTELFDSGRMPTAIFACNDIMAIGALNAARKKGLRVPEDVSIIGHDNTILAESGSLTSVDLKTQSVGHAAIDLLTHAMDDTDRTPRRLIIPPELVIRTSTGPVRSR